MSRALWRRLLALPGEVEAIYTEGWDRAERTYARLERAEAERAALALERDGLAAELQKVGAELARWKEAHGEASKRAESLAARVAQLGAAADQAGERAARAESERQRAADVLAASTDRAKRERAELNERIERQRAELLKVRRAIGAALPWLKAGSGQRKDGPSLLKAIELLEPHAPLVTADDVGGADGA